MNMFSDPIKIIEQFSFSTDHTIADFGAGNGAYSLALARSHRGDFSSTIYAVDILQDMLTKLKATAMQEGLENIIETMKNNTGETVFIAGEDYFKNTRRKNKLQRNIYIFRQNRFIQKK